jgi:hypothetical protein
MHPKRIRRTEADFRMLIRASHRFRSSALTRMDIIALAALTNMATPTKTDFYKALRTIGRPHGRQIDFLREHVNAQGRALTARRLADFVATKTTAVLICNTVCWRERSGMFSGGRMPT